MNKKATLQKIYGMKTFLLLFIISVLMSCDRKFYHEKIAVAQHLWQLKKIDTFYVAGRFKPSATWYNAYDKLSYVDNDQDFPYPFRAGEYVFNFDRK